MSAHTGDHSIVMSAPPGTVVHASVLPDFGTLTIATLDPSIDLAIVHEWVNAPGAEFYDLAGLTLDAIAAIYAALSRTTRTGRSSCAVTVSLSPSTSSTTPPPTPPPRSMGGSPATSACTCSSGPEVHR